MTRTLRVQVSEPASARLRLLKRRLERLRMQFVLKAGRNDLTVPTGRLSGGAYQLELTVADARGQHRVHRVALWLSA